MLWSVSADSRGQLETQCSCWFALRSGLKKSGCECCGTGPVNIHDRVLRAMDRPSLNHRDPWFPPFFSGILEDLKLIFATKEGTTFIFPGTGTGGWESALQNTLSPGDKVIADIISR